MSHDARECSLCALSQASAQALINGEASVRDVVVSAFAMGAMAGKIDVCATCETLHHVTVERYVAAMVQLTHLKK